MSIKELVESKRAELEIVARRLPLPGLIEWFFYNFWDEIEDNEETMDAAYPLLSDFYE